MVTTSTTTHAKGKYASKPSSGPSSGTCDTTMAHLTSDVSSVKLSTTSADSTTPSPNLKEGAFNIYKYLRMLYSYIVCNYIVIAM